MSINYLRLRLLLGFMLLVVVGAAVITFFAGRMVLSANARIMQRQGVIQALSDTLSMMADAETGQRGYLLTGEKSYLEPYDRAVVLIEKKLKVLQADAEEGTLDAGRVSEIRRLTDEKLGELKDTIAMHDTMGLEAALGLVRSGVGKGTMDRLRRAIGDALIEQNTELEQLEAMTAGLTALRTGTFVTCGGLEVLFCVWAYRRIVAEMKRYSDASIELRKQKNLLGVTLGSIGDAVMVCDTEARVTFMNPVAEALTGWSLQEVTGKPLSDIFRIINEESRKTVESPVEKVFRLGMVVGLANHTLLIRKDGSEVPIDDSGAPIRDETGKIYGVVLVFRDFTEHKNAEKVLMEAKSAAETANAAKDQFLATLSHELRTPLTPVAATLNMWDASAEVPAGLKADIQMMRRNIELEARLIDDLLDLTRITKGKLSLNMEAVNLQDLLTSVVGIVRADAAARKIKLAMHFNGRRNFVMGDSARLQQIMWNLLKNAIKFTPEGGEVAVETADDVPGSATFRVKDTGAGISEEMFGRLFRPFEQASERQRLGGLGLGLAISKALAEAQGGTISATSAGPGKGATFAVSFPAIEAPAEGTVKEPVPRNGGERRVRVLLVEDHVDSARALERVISKFGHEVRVGHSVAEGAALFDREHFDVLVSDLGLPDGSGLDLIRQIHAKRRVPAIALTGYGMEEDISRSRDAGFSEHLTKPINFQKLDAALSKVIEERAGRG